MFMTSTSLIDLEMRDELSSPNGMSRQAGLPVAAQKPARADVSASETSLWPNLAPVRETGRNPMWQAVLIPL